MSSSFKHVLLLLFGVLLLTTAIAGAHHHHPSSRLLLEHGRGDCAEHGPYPKHDGPPCGHHPGHILVEELEDSRKRMPEQGPPQHEEKPPKGRGEDPPYEHKPPHGHILSEEAVEHPLGCQCPLCKCKDCKPRQPGQVLVEEAKDAYKPPRKMEPVTPEKKPKGSPHKPPTDN